MNCAELFRLLLSVQPSLECTISAKGWYDTHISNNVERQVDEKIIQWVLVVCLVILPELVVLCKTLTCFDKACLDLLFHFCQKSNYMDKPIALGNFFILNILTVYSSYSS